MKYRCTCVICGTRFELEEVYDVCSLDCEKERLARKGDAARYIPERDDVIIQPEVVAE